VTGFVPYFTPGFYPPSLLFLQKNNFLFIGQTYDFTDFVIAHNLDSTDSGFPNLWNRAYAEGDKNL